MSLLSENLRYLRTTKNLSQKELADKLIVTRGRYAKYENSTTQPPFEILESISAYYRISIDLLVSADLQRVPQEDINQVESIISKFRHRS